jgi:hypothetical protein
VFYAYPKMKALNHNSRDFKMFVYLENALDISIYKPVFQFHGKSKEELVSAVFQFLKVSNNSKLRVDIYSARLGCVNRKRVSSLNAATDDVYIMLKGIEDGNK